MQILRVWIPMKFCTKMYFANLENKQLALENMGLIIFTKLSSLCLNILYRSTLINHKWKDPSSTVCKKSLTIHIIIFISQSSFLCVLPFMIDLQSPKLYTPNYSPLWCIYLLPPPTIILRIEGFFCLSVYECLGK